MKTASTLAPLVPLLAGAFLYGTANASNVRIIGGDKVSLEQYPYMVGLVGRGDSAEQAYCGASVISATWVLTAAHCVTGSTANSVDVITGVSVLSQANKGQRIAASRIIIHPGYDDNDDSLDNDIALIELSSPTTAPAVRVATPTDSAVFATGQAVSVSGWGNLSTTGEQFPDVLHAVDLQVSDFAACSAVYGGIVSSKICASVPGGKKDSCQGDSGGPLVAKTTEGPIQIGVVSYGDACASATYPGVYTKVSKFTEFLKQAGVDGSTELASVDTGMGGSDNEMPPTEDNAAEQESSNDSDANVEEDVDASENAGPPDSSLAEANESDIAALDANIVDPFFHVVADDTSWAQVELYNSGSDTLSLSNIQLPDGVSVYALSDDCTAVELAPEDACYLDLDWNPVNGSDLNSKLSVDVFDGAKSQTISLLLTGVVLDQVDVGTDIDWPMAEYYSEYPDEWEYDNSDVASGDSAISSDMDKTDNLNLIGVFDEQEDYELQFEYQLDGVNCHIYLDDDLAYELAAFDQWQLATLEVPAGAQVRWEFNAAGRDRGTRKVRLDALKISANSKSNPGNPLAASTSAIVNADSDSGAGAAGIGGLFVLLLLISMRRIVSTHTRTRTLL